MCGQFVYSQGVREEATSTVCLPIGVLRSWPQHSTLHCCLEPWRLKAALSCPYIRFLDGWGVCTCVQEGWKVEKNKLKDDLAVWIFQDRSSTPLSLMSVLCPRSPRPRKETFDAHPQAYMGGELGGPGLDMSNQDHRAAIPFLAHAASRFVLLTLPVRWLEITPIVMSSVCWKTRGLGL